MAQRSELYATKTAAGESADELCQIARPLIRAKARRLVQRPGFTPSDQEEIEQEAYLRLLDRFAAWKEGDLPVRAFIKRVVGQSISNQVRSRLAQKRNAQGVRSLNTPAVEADGELGDMVSQAHLDARRGRLSPEAQRLVDLGIDLDELLADLQQQQRDLCRELGLASISELARRLDMPRTTLQHQVRTLRRAFEDAGLKEYLK